MYTRVSLSDLPTPLERLSEISRIYDNDFFIKRDDLAGPEPGGNKTRKLEYILGEVKKENANHLITTGSPFSNHCRLTAMAALKYGLDCTLVLTTDQNLNDINYNGNYFIYDLLDVKIKTVPIAERKKAMEAEYSELKAAGKRPYLIESGGYGNAGTHGYVEAASELKADINFHPDRFDYLFVASGTGTTQAGLLVGNYIHHMTESIIGISVEADEKAGSKKIADCIDEYCKVNNLPGSLIRQDIIFIDKYRGKGYGKLDDEVIKAIKELARKEAILLDPVYTGQGFYGMLSFLQNNNIRHKKILFLHTGGLPILFNNSEVFK